MPGHHWLGSLEKLRPGIRSRASLPHPDPIFSIFDQLRAHLLTVARNRWVKLLISVRS